MEQSKKALVYIKVSNPAVFKEYVLPEIRRQSRPWSADGVPVLIGISLENPMLLEYIRTLKEDNLDLYECLDFMQLWYRDILMFKVTKDMNSLIFKDEYSAVSSCCQKSSYEGLEEILSAIEKAKVRLNANVNTDLALELMLLTMKEN